MIHLSKLNLLWAHFSTAASEIESYTAWIKVGLSHIQIAVLMLEIFPRYTNVH